MELLAGHVVGAAKEPMDAVEHVAVGPDPALEGVGDLLGTPVQSLRLGTVAGAHQREVDEYGRRQDEGGHGDRSGTAAD